MENNIVISGEIRFIRSLFNNDGKVNNAVTLVISDEEAKRVISALGIKTDMENIPVKTDDNGVYCAKAHSCYPISIYENGVKSDVEFSDIGNGSQVEIYAKLVEGRFKGKPYQTLYLKSMNVLKLLPYEEFNPFTN